MGQLARYENPENLSTREEFNLAYERVSSCSDIETVKRYRRGFAALKAFSDAQTKRGRLAAEGEVISERRLGELLLETNRNKGRGNESLPLPPKLAELGISKIRSSRAQFLARIPQPEFDERLKKSITPPTVNSILHPRRQTILQTPLRGTQGTGEFEWYTPVAILERSRAFLGEFDLDPASHAQAQESVKASRFFTIDDDGLAQDWHGRVWLNPPYAQPAIAQFCAKLIEEFQAGRVAEALLLTHNYTDTAWWQGVAAVASCFCFTSGRIRFVSPSGDLAAPTQGQVVSYLGDRAGEFRDHFESLGIVVFK